MNILVAESDPTAAARLRKTLEKLGHTVTVALDGEAAWKLILADRRGKIQALLTDWELPEIEGLELCRRIRAAERPAYLYVVMLTSRDQHADRQAAMEAGADDFLSKSLRKDELVSRLAVAQHVLTIQAQLREHTDALSALHDEFESQNDLLTNALAYAQVANRRFSELFMGVPVPCITCDERGYIQEWNQACQPLFGLRSDQVAQKILWEALSDADGMDFIHDTIKAALQGRVTERAEWPYLHPDGQRRFLLSNVFPLRIPDGSIVGAIIANVDITDRKSLEQRLADNLADLNRINAELQTKQAELAATNAHLQELSVTDSLTGLKNHKFFVEALEKGFAFAARHQMSLSIALMDIDHFQAFNESFGLPVGDEVLCAMTQILQGALRKEDLVARWSGGTFAALLWAADTETGALVAERLRRGIETYPWTLRPITASFGVATLHVGYENFTEMMEAAEKALVHSKRSGRNCVTHSQQLEHNPQR